LKTGAWGEDIQNIRRGISALGIGSEALKTAATKGDIANELSTEVAAMRARAAPPQGQKLPAGVKLSPGLHVDKNGNRIMVNPDGTYSEAPR
jgi:hypothetical protein